MNLTPSEKYLAHLFWPDLPAADRERNYQWFMAELEGQPRTMEGPTAGPVAITFGISTLLSVGFSAVAAALRPRPPQQRDPLPPPSVETSQESGAATVSGVAYSPSAGFGAIQQPATLFSPIPALWTREEYLPARENPYRPAGWYGGRRISMPLLWSSVWSLRGRQLLRGIWLVGEGPCNGLDPKSIAIGNNSTGAFDLGDATANESGAEITAYYRGDTGRLVGSDRVAGRAADQDPANSENDGADDVFQVRDVTNSWAPDFSYSYTPSNVASFGLFNHCPNKMSLRVNGRMRPTLQLRLRPIFESENQNADPEDDPGALGEVWKSKFHWSMRCGVTATSTGLDVLNIGDSFTYRLEDASDIATVIRFDTTNTDINSNDSAVDTTCEDIASSVASIQKSVDQNLVIGNVYKFGSVLAVLVSRTPDVPFSSDADFNPPTGGQGINYTFKVIEAGQLQRVDSNYMTPSWSGATYTPPRWFRESDLGLQTPPDTWEVCSGFAQGFECQQGYVSLNRPARVFEFSIRSRVGISVNGLLSMRNALTFTEIAEKAGQQYAGLVVAPAVILGTSNWVSGTVSFNEYRYSFFRLLYRENSSLPFVALTCSVAVKGITQQDVHNYIRIVAPCSREWQFKFDPIPSWAIRKGYANTPYIVLDASISSPAMQTVDGFILHFNGGTITTAASNFGMPTLEPPQDLGYGWTDTESSTMLDGYARVAEVFAYSEVTTSATRGPEHEIVTVNLMKSNPVPPLYDSLAKLGMNIWASRRIGAVQQVSAWFTGGLEAPRLIEGADGPTHLWPDVLKAYQLNPRYGKGEHYTAEMIDDASYLTAAQWCQSRRYFYDAYDTNPEAIISKAVQLSEYHLLDMVKRGGKWYLEPLLIFDTPVPISAAFTYGNRIEGSLQVQFNEYQERLPIRVSVKFIINREDDEATPNGMFPYPREILIQAADTPDTAELVSYDLSAFCTNPYHAIDFAAYKIRQRQYQRRSGKLITTPAQIGGDILGRYFYLYDNSIAYDNAAIGSVLPDGTLITSRPDLLAVGANTAMIWDGVVGNAPAEGTLTVGAGKTTATPEGVMFAVGSAAERLTCKCTAVRLQEDGNVQIDFVEHPTDDAGISLLTKNWTTYVSDAYWTIRPEIGWPVSGVCGGGEEQCIEESSVTLGWSLRLPDFGDVEFQELNPSFATSSGAAALSYVTPISYLPDPINLPTETWRISFVCSPSDGTVMIVEGCTGTNVGLSTRWIVDGFTGITNVTPTAGTLVTSLSFTPTSINVVTPEYFNPPFACASFGLKIETA